MPLYGRAGVVAPGWKWQPPGSMRVAATAIRPGGNGNICKPGMLPYSFAMGGNGVNRRTVLAGFAAAGFGLATGACTASAEATEAGTQLWRCVTPAGSITTLVIADSVVCAGIVATYPDLARK